MAHFVRLIGRLDLSVLKMTLALAGGRKEFVAFLQRLVRAVPAALDLHVILDNSSTHKAPEVQEFLQAHPRVHLHFTPTGASWLNAVEGWFSQLERRCLHRGVFTSVGALRQELRRFIAAHNRKSAKPFVWTKTAESILDACRAC